ncbi:UNKNOWN [Stylonychia lemnae]|uniref:Uncharacterized protein n=1 Tax=Stylonychia lemnae TaxID=5949 RepID=A0A077ZPT2_STYLE|nr:UNKNOWN [Stylonychia lemnae]|eukprot:CDW71469.1 UNKNOWN [Stylonychia lemnae]
MEFVEPNIANSDGQRSDYRYEMNLFRCDSESTPFYTAKNTQKDDKSSVYQSNVNFDDQRNFNEQEIEDFFGVDYQEMQRIVQVSQKYLNNVKLIMDEEKAVPSPVKIDALRCNAEWSSQKLRTNAQKPIRIEFQFSRVSQCIKDHLTNEVIEEADVEDWIETLSRQNNDNCIIDGVASRKIVGFTCFYRQNNRMLQEKEDFQKVQETLEQLQGKIASARSESMSSQQKQMQMAKKYEEQALIGMILMKFQKPTDSDFPETLKHLPVFWPFKKSQPTTQDQTPQSSQSNTPLQSSVQSQQHQQHEINKDDLEKQMQAQEKVLKEKALKSQVAKIIFLGVVPQCKRSGIGTLIYKKCLHIVENQFPNCILLYYLKNPDFLSSNFRSIQGFLVRNHFKILNESRQLGETISDKTVFYYNITSLQMEQKYSMNGLFAEFIKVLCKNPLALCHREGQKKLKKELKRVKHKYENQDFEEDDVEEFKTEQDRQESDQLAQRNNNQNNQIQFNNYQQVGLNRYPQRDVFEINDNHLEIMDIVKQQRQHNLDNQI